MSSSPSCDGKLELRRQFGVLHGVGVICGLVIGSGIFISPGAVVLGTGSTGLALVSWGMAGVLATLGALSFAELGATIPYGGEKYAYLDQIYGPFTAFLYQWSYLILGRPGGNTVKCLTFAQYVLQLFYGDCPASPLAVSLVASCLVGALTVINIIRVRWAANMQATVTMTTLVTLLGITVIGLVYIIVGSTEHVSPQVLFQNSETDPAKVVFGFYAAIFAIWGWSALNFLTEEVKDPQRTLPRAVYISMFLLTLLYMSVNFSYLAVLGPQGVRDSKAVALSFAQKALGHGFAWMIPLCVAVSTAGSLNGGTLVGSRLAFVAARHGHMPHVLALIHTTYRSPVTALLFQMMIVILMCFTVQVYVLLNYLVFGFLLFDFLAVAGLVYWRFRYPHMRRAVKMPLVVPLLFLLLMFIILTLPLLSKPAESVTGIAIVLGIGCPLYAVGVLWEKKPKSLRQKIGCFTQTVQKITNSSFQETDVEF